MPTLFEALGRRGTAVHQEFHHRLRTLASVSATHRQAYINLQAESRLGFAAWDEIIGAVLSGDPSPDALQDRLRDTYRKYLLTGPDVRACSSVVLGRAVTVERFCTMLKDRNMHPDIDSARDELESISKLSVAQLQRRWERRELGRYLMWGTFSQDPGDPFLDMHRTTDAFRCILGLDQNESGLALLLLTYSLPHTVTACFPTIADAYSGDVWVYYFRPASPTDPHGWTLTWDKCSDQSGRPEIVHRVITGERLTAVPQVLL